MAPAPSCDLGAKEPRTINGVNVQILPGRNLKRKLQDWCDLGKEGEKKKRRAEKKSRSMAGAQGAKLDRAVDDEHSSAHVEGTHVSDTHRSRKKVIPNSAHSVQSKPGVPLEQLPFEGGQTFDNIAEPHDHDDKHKQQRPIRCRKCRQSFTDAAERDHHFQTSSHHFCCRYCKDVVVAFSNADSLRYHYIDSHRELYCHFCDRHFSDSVQRHSHMEARHRSCLFCRKMFPVPELCDDRCGTCYPETFGKDVPSDAEGSGDGCSSALEEAVKIWKYFGKKKRIVRYDSQEQVPAQEMRVMMHPDRRKRGGVGLTGEEMSKIDKEAAADVLSDPVLRLKYGL